MNENIDLTKILKNCPEGYKFWSPLLGNVEFSCIYQTRVRVKTVRGNLWELNQDGTAKIGADIASPEIMLYPSNEQRDWSKFIAPWFKKDRFNPKTLKPFDKVIARSTLNSKWRCTFFSHLTDEGSTLKYITSDYSYPFCIPYNDETKHLAGTTKEAPDYYRYWEDIKYRK